MITFEKYSLETLKKYAPLVDASPYNVNDISKSSFYMWNEGVNLAFASVDGAFVSVQDICGEPSFSYPYGGDEQKALEQIVEYVKTNDFPLKFYGIDEQTLEKIKSNRLFKNVLYNYERKWSDYVYSAQEMATFKGKKFSGQRNHINKFISLYGQPKFKPLEREDIPKIKETLVLYAKEHPSPCYEENAEYRHALELVDAFFDLDMLGGALWVDDRPISITIGEVQNGENLIIGVEKALKSYVGAYPATFNSFVKYALSLYPDLKTVNREDDSGDLGLRTSKTQYKPIKLVDKYVVKIDSPLFGLDNTPVLTADGVVLSEITENDKAAYAALCVDKENNALWGYDYETDPSITGEINDDTFFDVVAFDRSVGDGISFAVREKSVDNRLIGELIIYNFSYNGKAQIGVRIERNSQGKGFGKKAFAIGADFAEKILGVKPWAKCYKENIRSKSTILSCGFKQTDEDQTFFYFSR